MKSNLLASLESHIQDWMDEHAQGYDWPSIYVSEETIASMARAAALIIDTTVQAQKDVEENVL